MSFLFINVKLSIMNNIVKLFVALSLVGIILLFAKVFGYDLLFMIMLLSVCKN